MEDKAKKEAEEKLRKRYRDSFLRLEEQIKNARFSNDTLSRQLFDLNNRTQGLAEIIGFPTFEDLEGAVFDEPGVWNVDAIRAARPQEAASGEENSGRQEVENAECSGLDKFKAEFEQLKHQVSLLQQGSALNTLKRPASDLKETTVLKRSPLTPLKSVGNTDDHSEEPDLRGQLVLLSRKYDALVATKERAEKKYKEDYRKWKLFKSWLFNKSKHGAELRAQLTEEKLDFGIGLDTTTDSTKSDNTLRRRHSSPINPLDELQNKITPISPSHPTREKANPKPRIDTDLFAGLPNSPSPKVKTRKEVHKGKVVPEKSGSAEGNSKIKTEALSSPEFPSSSAKGKSRYKEAPISSDTINALYKINTSRNNGLEFQFDDVVRGKEHRHRLEAGDCDCCKEYYDRVEPLPGRLAPPAWDSSSTPISVTGHNHHHGQQPQTDTAGSHKKQISRHRHQWSPPTTPPDYWNIGFPSTQEAADINRRAADMHADKRRRVEKEADTMGGRYIRRPDKK